MKASFVELRTKSADIIRAIMRNERVTLLYRGKPAAVMLPIDGEVDDATSRAAEHAAFGIWADREDLKDPSAHVRDLRRGRFSDL